MLSLVKKNQGPLFDYTADSQMARLQYCFPVLRFFGTNFYDAAAGPACGLREQRSLPFQRNQPCFILFNRPH
ncbi:hypothetical protein CS542_04775 [Pedobacter sp. IW39]|nr:hypothetical protein CS542_04775 [Pedobacter sp. IW39]